MIKELADMNNVKFLNHGNDERFQMAAFFQDAGHLNDTAVKEYSRELAGIVKKLK